MNDTKTETQSGDLVFEYALDAPPQKVWRAITVPAFREKWLPKDALAEAAPVSSAPGEEVRYRMKDDEPPFLESMVTFQLRPGADGGTILRVIHGLVDDRLVRQQPRAANSNGSCLMLAA